MNLALDDVSVSYQTSSGRSLDAIRSISVAMSPGEIVTIIGPSGCGKSTMLHCMGGLIKPTSGSVKFDGVTVTGPDPRQAAYVFQDYALLPWRSVVDNAALGLKFAHVLKRERRAKALSYLKMVGLESFADAYPSELSGGMQQRVAVCRALAMEPKALLLDEPFGALDEQSRRRIGLEMAGLIGQTGQTTVMVTHSLDEAIFWADRVLLMSARPGRILEDITVPMQRPRDLSVMVTPEFEELRLRLFKTLELNAGTSAALASGGTVDAEVGS